MQRWFQAADTDDAVFVKMHSQTLHHSLDSQGNTALIRAAFAGSLNVVNLLLQEARVQNSVGRSALMQSIFSPNAANIVPILAQEECGLQDGSGQTALMLASSQGKHFLLTALIKETKLKDMKGRTALMLAAVVGSLDCCQILQHHEAKLQDRQGLTALMYAAYKGFAEIVQLLAEKEARIINSKGETALAIAVQRGNRACIEVLMRYESDVKILGLGVLEYCEEVGANQVKPMLQELMAVEELRPENVFRAPEPIAQVNQPYAYQQLPSSQRVPDKSPEQIAFDAKKQMGITALDDLQHARRDADDIQSGFQRQLETLERLQQEKSSRKPQQLEPRQPLPVGASEPPKQGAGFYHLQQQSQQTQVQQLQEMNEAIMAQFSQLQQEVQRQLQAFQLKASQLDVNFVKLQPELGKIRDVHTQMELVQGQISQLEDAQKQLQQTQNQQTAMAKQESSKTDRALSELKTQIEEVSTELQESVAQLRETVQKQDKDIRTLQNHLKIGRPRDLFAPDPTAQFSFGSQRASQHEPEVQRRQETAEEAPNTQHLAAEVAQLQENMVRLLQVVTTQSQQSLVVEIQAQVETLALEVAKLKASNQEARLEAVEKAVAQLYMLK